MIRAMVAVSAWAVLWAAPESSAQEAPLDCGKWNTEEYFTTATVQDVKVCLAGADPNARDEDEKTPLYVAARYSENPEVHKVLLVAGADPNVQAEYRETPLHQAAGFNKNPEVHKVLLAAGADPMARKRGWGDAPA